MIEANPVAPEDIDGLNKLALPSARPWNRSRFPEMESAILLVL